MNMRADITPRDTPPPLRHADMPPRFYMLPPAADFAAMLMSRCCLPAPRRMLRYAIVACRYASCLRRFAFAAMISAMLSAFAMLADADATCVERRVAEYATLLRRLICLRHVG